jgi:2-polyprenyl-3-methyl-5-hydroxy-6-metoxy-1,4-benzoquinol methylase
MSTRTATEVNKGLSSMRFESVWLSDIKFSPLLEDVRQSFIKEYENRFGAGEMRGLYKRDDWARISFCYERVSRMGGSILDIGVGPGGLLNILSLDKRFTRVTGIDVRHYSKLVKMKDNLDIRIMDVGEMSFADNSFDTLVCMEVLEHIEKSHFLRALSELRRVAAKQLFMTIPLREPEPLPAYHKLRFDFADIEEHFPDGDFYILEPERGVPWLVIIEDLEVKAVATAGHIDVRPHPDV